jgi:hypothetical protein
MRMNRFLILGVLCAVPLLASDPFLGSWKFNPQKSKAASTSFKNWRSVVEAIGPNSWRLTTTGDGSDRNGQKSVETIIFDGKEHTWTDGEVVRYERIDEFRVKSIQKKNGHSEIVDLMVSDDAKTLTVRFKGYDPNTGKPIDEIDVFDRE